MGEIIFSITSVTCLSIDTTNYTISATQPDCGRGMWLFDSHTTVTVFVLYTTCFHRQSLTMLLPNHPIRLLNSHIGLYIGTNYIHVPLFRILLCCKQLNITMQIMETFMYVQLSSSVHQLLSLPPSANPFFPGLYIHTHTHTHKHTHTHTPSPPPNFLDHCKC